MQNTILSIAQIRSMVLSCLKQEQNIAQIILFGSYATGNPHPDSDIDLVILLKDKGIASSYRERLNRTKHYSRLLNPVRDLVSMDVLVLTEGEWKLMKTQGSLFLKEIQAKGIKLR